MYIWRLNNDEIEEYRISISKKQLKEYVEETYVGYNIVFLEHEEEEYDFGFITLITQI